MNKQALKLRTGGFYEYTCPEGPSPVKRTMDKYGCSSEDAQRFLDLREEGYSIYQAKLMAGLCDPDY